MKMHLKPVKILIFISVISVLLYGLKAFLSIYLDPFGGTQWNQFKRKDHEAQVFKEKLEVEHILKRSQNCSNYFETLAALIYKLPPGQMIDIKKYTNPDAKSYVKNNSMAVSYVVHDNPGIFEILFHIT